MIEGYTRAESGQVKVPKCKKVSFFSDKTEVESTAIKRINAATF